MNENNDKYIIIRRAKLKYILQYEAMSEMDYLYFKLTLKLNRNRCDNIFQITALFI